ncbi:MAG TPA: hypothetical protein VD927_06625 [Chryseosolibacter sp.]|nr:hypothetical protein [Chryseosolibacter sp.]
MELRELSLAIDGYKEDRASQFQDLMYASRIVAFWAAAPHLPKKARIKKPADLFELPGDKEAKKDRVKRMKPIQRIDRSDAKQSNG